MEFTQNIEQLALEFKSRKDHVVYFLKRHFKEGEHYIVQSVIPIKGKGWSGQNKKIYMLTNPTYELIKSSYNLKHRYMPKVMDVKMTNPLLMTIENATIGFICQTLTGIVDYERQYRIGKYYVDLYLPVQRIAIECDEFAHNRNNPEEEKLREEHIRRELECEFIRYNPCSNDFDFSTLLNTIFRTIIK